MSFFNETILKLGLAPQNCIGGYKISIFDGIGALIEGHKGLTLVSKEEIGIKVKGSNINIKGSNLIIKSINGEEVYITGKIANISRE